MAVEGEQGKQELDTDEVQDDEGDEVQGDEVQEDFGEEGDQLEDEGDEQEGDEQDEAGIAAKETKPSSKKNPKKSLLMSPEALKEFNDAVEQTGVVFISRVPPFMSVTTLRRLLSQFGEIGRIYLTPEDKSVTKRRKRNGGTNKKKFVDGWVEFMRKKIAKRVCRSLNGTPIGGSHRNKFASDLWTLKYLRGFKWNHLTEKISSERANRDNKIQLEMSQSKKAVKWTMKQAEKAKTIKRMEQHQKATGKRKREGVPEIERNFKQRELRTFDD